MSENNYADKDQQSDEKIIVQGVAFTPEEIEQANLPQPNVIVSEATDGLNTGTPRDANRVSQRANEAPDRNDSNTGSMISGGAKGASQS